MTESLSPCWQRSLFPTAADEGGTSSKEPLEGLGIAKKYPEVPERGWPCRQQKSIVSSSAAGRQV